jgi:AbrB family looped-hinge helix DNA binding protein
MVLLTEERKIGPKGQIVIPKAFRKAKGMVPGDKVVVKLEEGGIVIDKPEIKAEEIFEKMAKSVKSKRDWSKVDWHELHEERMREYMKKKGW